MACMILEKITLKATKVSRELGEWVEKEKILKADADSKKLIIEELDFESDDIEPPTLNTGKTLQDVADHHLDLLIKTIAELQTVKIKVKLLQKLIREHEALQLQDIDEMLGNSEERRQQVEQFQQALEELPLSGNELPDNDVSTGGVNNGDNGNKLKSVPSSSTSHQSASIPNSN